MASHILISIDQWNKWPRHRSILVAALSAVAILGGGDRSPVMLIASYAIVRFIYRCSGKGISIRQWITVSVGIYFLALFISLVPAWRAGLVGNEWNGKSFAEITSRNIRNPIGGLAEYGAVDTLDGMVLVEGIVERMGDNYSWIRLTDAVLLFIPSQIWDSKPRTVWTEISQSVLGYGASGMFLSGAGYIDILFRSSAAQLLVWAAIGGLASLLLSAVSISRHVVLKEPSWFILSFGFGLVAMLSMSSMFLHLF